MENFAIAIVPRKHDDEYSSGGTSHCNPKSSIPGRKVQERCSRQLATRCAKCGGRHYEVIYRSHTRPGPPCDRQTRPQRVSTRSAQRVAKIAQTLPAADAHHGGDGPRPTGASERRHEPRTVGRLQPRPCRSAAPQTRAPGPQNCSSCPPRLASRQASSRAPSRRSSRAPCRTHSRSAGGGSALAGALLGGQTAAVLRVWALSDRPEPGAARVRDGDVELQEALFASRKGAKRSLGRPCPGATKLGGLGGGAGLTLDQRKLGILRVPTGTRASS